MGALATVTATAAPSADPAAAATLAELRAERRAAVRAAATAARRDGGAPFGLLVIPVDFADRRFPAGFDPAADLRLTGDPDGQGSLAHYVTVASRGRTALSILRTAVVSLPGTRQDYSDLGWQGFTRSRAMVRQAVAAVVARGVDLAAADADADGEVDGILLLHAGPGLENDPDGLIPPQQFFLADPVVHRGIVARSYAFASATSTLGVWAHETGHLLGLEDRYDLDLPGSGETGPRGGLGRFSLMAAGWLGSGAGRDPALPDAWSRLQLGWADRDTVARAGTVVRLRSAGPPRGEHFLAAWRDPAAAAPYDGGLPRAGLVIYHVDPSLAAGEASGSTFGPDRHLQVEVVEADGGRAIARGESQGEAADLFPTSGATQRFADTTVPDSRTWGGEATGVDVAVTVAGGEVVLEDRGPRPWADVRLVIETDAEGLAVRPLARLAAPGPRPDTLTVVLAVADARWGRFEAGDHVVAHLLRRDDPGGWAHYRGRTWRWQRSGTLPDDAVTPLTYALGEDPDAPADGRAELVWNPRLADLALTADWSDRWRVSRPGQATGATWHRWDGQGHPGLPDGPLLAATGEDHATAAAWPEVRYGGGAHARLESPPLGTAVRWVALVHAVDLELLFPGSAADGVALTWVHASGAEVPATPADGWAGVVDPRARHPLSGRPTFAWDHPLGADQRPLWHREVLPLPDPATHGPGPWRLRAELASNAVFAARGWLLREPTAHTDAPPASGFPVTLDGRALGWEAPAVPEAGGVRLERSDDGGASWQTVGGVRPPGTRSAARASLGLLPGVRSRLRVVLESPAPLASRPLVVAAAVAPALGAPRPNPAHGPVTLVLDAGGDPRASLAMYDLRGRRIRHWTPGAGPATITWDGTGGDGRPAAAGVYLLRLEAAGEVVTRKLTWIP